MSDLLVLDEGGEQQLVTIVRNQDGRSMGIAQTINFSTTSRTTATVGEGGFVTALGSLRSLGDSRDHLLFESGQCRQAWLLPVCEP